MVKRLGVTGTILIATLATRAYAQAPAAPAQPAAPPPAQAAPPPGYAYPPPGYGYPPPGYGYPPPGYGYPPSGYAYPPPAYPMQPVAAPPPPAGFHEHDNLYVRAQFGISYTKMSVNDPFDGEVTYTGNGGSIGVAAGFAVVPNLVLYGTGLVAGAGNPTVKVAGFNEGDAPGNTNFHGLGVGAAYYVMPANAFVAASALATWLEITNLSNGRSGWTKAGFGLEALIGKEWWVSTNWGLGLSLQFLYGRMTDDSITLSSANKWTTVGGAFMFSATYN